MTLLPRTVIPLCFKMHENFDGFMNNFFLCIWMSCSELSDSSRWWRLTSLWSKLKICNLTAQVGFSLVSKVPFVVFFLKCSVIQLSVHDPCEYQSRWLRLSLNKPFKFSHTTRHYTHVKDLNMPLLPHIHRTLHRAFSHLSTFFHVVVFNIFHGWQQCVWAGWEYSQPYQVCFWMLWVGMIGVSFSISDVSLLSIF